jgi:CHAD domain-containing protein
MISRKKFNSFFNERFEGITNSLDALCNQWDAETLHELRVHSKRTKALAKLLSECSNEKKAFKTPELKALFKHAGNIRTAELHLEIFEQHNITVESLIEAQRNIIATESEKLCSQKKIYTKDIQNLHYRFADNVLTIKNESIVKYYRNSLSKLMSYFVSPIDVALLHESRKLIKNLLYPLKLMPLLLLNKLNLNEEYLDYCQDTIGKWHDAGTTLELLKQAGYENLTGYESLNNYMECLYSSIEGLSIDFDKKIIGLSYNLTNNS